MSRKNCSEVTARLDDYLADRLEGTELQKVIAHLAGCPACRLEAEAADPVKFFVPLAGRAGEGGRNWDGFWVGIAERLPEQSRRRAGRLIPFPGSIRWVAAAGAVAATALLGIFLVQQADSPMAPPAAETARQETAPPPTAEDADGLMESIYIDRIAEALPAQYIERRGEVRALRLTRVDERGSDSVSQYRAGGEPMAATVSDIQLADQMESIIEYSLVISENEAGGAEEEVRVVSFESDQFPFGCLARGEAEENGDENR